jgi:hypothetical protein
MAKMLSIKKARILYEENLDRWKRPTARTGSASAFTVERVLDSKGKVVARKVRPAK